MPKKHRMLPTLTSQQISRFLAKVRKGAPNACWPWVAFCHAAGYGRVNINRKAWPAHRIAYLIAHGPFPHRLCVMHTCDNPPCCNPAHLWLGTHGENMADMARKRRHGSRRHPEGILRGEGHGTAKFTAANVREIRRRHAAGKVTQAALATEYNVSRANINIIVHRRAWSHIL